MREAEDSGIDITNMSVKEQLKLSKESLLSKGESLSKATVKREILKF